jgi:carboxyl-terminal processing protease
MPRQNLIILLVAALASLACYQRASRNRFVDTFAEAMNYVRQDYVDEVEPRALFEGAMQGMMDQLDMYSGYTPPDEYLEFKETMEGEFPGIGIMVEQNAQTKELTVLMPLRGSPAAEAGIRARDVIVAIGGEPTAGVPLEKSIERIKGRTGSRVNLSVRRAGQEELLTFEVPRASIPIESVLGDARQADGTWIYRLVAEPRIGYIRISNFAERTVDDLRQALASYRQPGGEIDGLVIDLRNDEGGLLKAAVQTCDLLLDGGLIVSTRGRGGVEKSSYHAQPGVELDPDIPVALLVDRFSASASEIVAACLQDHGRAAIIGQRTWGKGTVQNLIELEGGKSALRLTIASYWRPSGKDIHKRRTSKESDDWGVRPDPGLEIALNNEQYSEWLAARRDRDIAPLADLEAAARAAKAKAKHPTGKSAVKPPKDDGSEAPSAEASPPKPPVPDPDASEDEPETMVWSDPQLDKAVEVLKQRIEAGGKSPRRA